MVVQRVLRVVLLAVVFLWLTSRSSSFATGQRDRVSKHLRRLYKALAIRRKYSSLTTQELQRRPPLQASDMQWSNASLYIYFNLTDIHHKSTITKGHLLLNKRRDSYTASPYQQSYGIVVADGNTGEVIFNRTVAASRQRLRLINLVDVIKRWQKYPGTNKGLLMTVRDTGIFERTLWTFYPRSNVYVPALAIFLQEGNYFPKYKMVPCQIVQLRANGVPDL